MADRFRCSVAAEGRPDQMIGSATHLGAFVLLEHPGPWGRVALRDAPLPGNLLAALRRRASSARVRILLCRRYRQREQDGVRVFAVSTSPREPWVETAVLDEHRDVLDLDLEGLRLGRRPGLTPHLDPVFAVCTHGRHDACCAERGRPVSAALAEAFPEDSWEVSHLGGDRFAGNMLVLPEGLGYGWTDPVSAVRVAENHRAGRLTPEHLRGRAGYPMPVQYAEWALRERLDRWDLDAVHLAEPWERTATRWRAVFEVAGATRWAVEVIRSADDSALLTCSAHQENPVPRFELASLAEVA